MIYLKLFFAFLQIGMFSFGGGYAAMPLIQHQVVDTYHWLDGKGFADLVTISQMTPGPIATNAATFVGMNTAGLAGALIATFGCIPAVLCFGYIYCLLLFKISKARSTSGCSFFPASGSDCTDRIGRHFHLGFCLLERTDCDPSAGYRLGYGDSVRPLHRAASEM